MAMESTLDHGSRPEGAVKMRLENLDKHFTVNQGILNRIFRGESSQYVHAVDDVTLSIGDGEAFGLAGESGCGKTTLGKTAIKLLESTNGKIHFDGEDITDLSRSELKAFRREAQIIHQNPYESINPRFTVYEWVEEPLLVHDIGTEEEREARVLETLEMSGLTPPEAYASEYPSELSGGERQRVGIARALVLEPSFLLADEPASMLDVSIRASILDVFSRLQSELGLTALYISHDLSLLKHICDRIGIMYLGQLVEVGPADEIINNPQHPYTKALVSSVPRVNPDETRERIELVGEVPDAVDVPSGCRFNSRCPSLVPPEDVELEQPVWRSVANLRNDLVGDEVTTTGDDGFDPAEIRRDYDVPDRLPDPRVEDLLSSALDQYASGEAGEPIDRLAESLESPCEREPIPTYQATPVQRSKCILHDPDGPYQVSKGVTDD